MTFETPRRHLPPSPAAADRIELWVGPEPSVVRIGDRRTDQLASTGFAHRLDDLDRLAALGAARVRMPILWERTETPAGRLDFAWADARMERLRELGMAAIVGLVHHGSGPLHTNLLDAAFPDRLGDYAARVAERYAWVDAWTPVNEPLTTARFSALYGLWYPHRRDDASFVRALLQQVHATVIAMRRIRAVNPRARLVQTEDLGRTEGTAAMRGQIRFDNHRRWLSLDLLCGRVGPAHPMWDYLRTNGATAAELDGLRDEPTPPDVIGINHYVTSDRFLDHRLARYPGRHQTTDAGHRGGNNTNNANNNEQPPYVDIEAVRIRGAALGGFAARLAEAARRYRRPLAITEVQMGCTREEQLRWFHEAWQAAAGLRARGVDVRAVTAWAAFGAHDWNSLLTEARGVYDPGLFDVRSPLPRPTALATLATELAHGREPSHPVLQSPGWWHRAERHAFAPHGPLQTLAPGGTPVLIVGAHGTLGQALARLCRQRGLAYEMPGRDVVDIADAGSVAAALARWSPWAVLNAAGYVRVDDAEDDPRQWLANAVGPAVLGRECRRAGVRLLTFSSDLVFDGRRAGPYRESDAPRPLNAYGRAKRHAEEALAGLPGVLVIRSAAFFGPWDQHNFLALGLARLQRGETWAAIGDQTVSPTYVPDLVNASLDLLIDGEQGLWHLANGSGDGGDGVSWYEFACRAAEAAGLPRRMVQRINGGAAAGQRAVRPANSALASERGTLLQTLDAALLRFVRRTDGHPGDVAPASRFGGDAAAAVTMPDLLSLDMS